MTASGEDRTPAQVPNLDDLIAEMERWDPVPRDKPEEPAEVEQQEEANYDKALRFAELQAFDSHHKNKGDWSKFMMEILAVLVAFQMLLLAMVGFGWWDFTKYDWLLPALLVQNLAQVVGLVFVIVKSLFGNFKK